MLHHEQLYLSHVLLVPFVFYAHALPDSYQIIRLVRVDSYQRLPLEWVENFGVPFPGLRLILKYLCEVYYYL